MALMASGAETTINGARLSDDANIIMFPLTPLLPDDPLLFDEVTARSQYEYAVRVKSAIAGARTGTDTGTEWAVAPCCE